MRWAGSKSGLYPSDPTNALLCDEISCTVFECLSKVPPAAGEEGKAKREECTRPRFKIDGASPTRALESRALQTRRSL